VEEAQQKICPQYKVFQPVEGETRVYNELYPLYRKLYFALGEPRNGSAGDILPALIKIAEAVNNPH
jgi:L-ribulokinase